ncbi:MAG: DUF2723 domain-containing protein [Thermoanaerobaculia bacterium]|nr:DUF2723 domain-containing protein [Thermoanaerobaculia bacterium]
MSRAARGEALWVFLVCLVIYTLGACRTIYVGDSGELVAAAATLGIPHPSGYPLYVLLGHLWIQLLGVVGVDSVAFRMSLFSVFFAGLSCTLFWIVCRRGGVVRPMAWLATLLFGLSPSFWSQAGVQRVYSLNAFFAIAVVGLALEWYRSGDATGAQRDVRWMAAAAFAAGLGATNHTVIGVLGVAVGLFAVAVQPSWLRRPKHLATCVGAGVAGLLPYVYLPIRSAQEPRLDWGDPDSLEGFLDVVLRRDFWHRAWIEGPADAVTIFFDWFVSLGAELTVVGSVLALMALWAGRRSSFRCSFPVALPLAVMAANLWAVGAHGSRSDIFIWHRYYIPSYAMLALLAAWGAQVAWQRWGRRTVILLLLPPALLVLGWTRHDRSDFRIADDFSRTLLTTLPPGAHLAASDDNILFVLIYLHLVEGLRPDVDLILQGVGDADLPPLRFDPDDDPLFFTHHPNWNLAGIEVVPVGMVYQTVRPGVRPEVKLPKPELDGAWDPRVPKDYLAQNLVGHFHFMAGVSYEETDWPRAEREFRRALEAAPDNDVLFYNLGLIYRRNGLSERALAAFRAAREINPRHIPSSKPVRSADKVAELENEVEQLRRLREEAGTELDLDTASGLWQLARRVGSGGEPQLNVWARGFELQAQEIEAGLADRE